MTTPPALTARQGQVLELYGQGYNDPMIAEALGVTRARIQWIRKRLQLPRLHIPPRHPTWEPYLTICMSKRGHHEFMRTRPKQQICPEHATRRHPAICTRCGTPFPSRTSALCLRCRQRTLMLNLHAARTQQGLCIQCPSPGTAALAGRTICQRHAERQRQYDRTYKALHPRRR
jgi:hypothetical protein